MSIWKPHALAGTPRPQLELKRHAKVRNIVELPGVPEGTKGKVLLANGFNWLRYRVLFENGVEMGDLDARHLEPVKKPKPAKAG